MPNDFSISNLEGMNASRLLLDRDGESPVQGKTGFKGWFAALFKKTSMGAQNKLVWDKLKDVMTSNLENRGGEDLANEVLSKYNTSKPLSSRKAANLLKKAEGLARKQDLQQLFGKDNTQRAIQDLVGSDKPVVLGSLDPGQVRELIQKANTYETLENEGIGKTDVTALRERGISPEQAELDPEAAKATLRGIQHRTLDGTETSFTRLRDRVVKYDPGVVAESKANRFFLMHGEYAGETRFDVNRATTLVKSNAGKVVDALRAGGMSRTGRISARNLETVVAGLKQNVKFSTQEKLFFALAEPATVKQVLQRALGRMSDTKAKTIHNAIKDSMDLIQVTRYGKKLGSGTGGVAFLAEIVKDGEPKRAVTKLDFDTRLADGDAEDIELGNIRHEALLQYAVAGDLKHPNIASYEGLAMRNGKPLLIQEFIPGGTLQKVINESPNNQITTTQARYIARNVVAGLFHLKQAGVRHNDIKPENVMFNAETKQPVIIDIGGATDEGAGAFTERYCSPEQIHRKHNVKVNGKDVEVDNRSDVYALGCTIGHMITGVSPFSHLADQATIMATRKNHPDTRPFTDADWAGVDPGMRTLIEAMISTNPEDRPTLEQLMKATENLAPGETDENPILGILRMASDEIHTAQDGLAQVVPAAD